jgi:hypothetical protein
MGVAEGRCGGGVATLLLDMPAVILHDHRMTRRILSSLYPPLTRTLKPA